MAAVAFAALALMTAGIATGSPKGNIQMETDTISAELIGKPIGVAQQKLGKPIEEDQFKLGMAVLEFRVELLNFFDETRRSENPPQIREVTWSLSSQENLTLWFTQSDASNDWCAIHSHMWHPDDQF